MKGMNEEKPEEAQGVKSNITAKVHCDGVVRIPKALRSKLGLEPGTHYEFSIVECTPGQSFTIKAVKVEG